MRGGNQTGITSFISASGSISTRPLDSPRAPEVSVFILEVTRLISLTASVGLNFTDRIGLTGMVKLLTDIRDAGGTKQEPQQQD